MRLFEKKDCNTFKYWFAHWCAFQVKALLCERWRPGFLLHDLDKPFLMLIFRDRHKVQKIHKTHCKHHICYHNRSKVDWVAVVLDWSCARDTKAFAQLTASEVAGKFYKEGKLNESEFKNVMRIIHELGLP